jgi:hypothetical protein
MTSPTDLFDQPDFPKFSAVSTGLRDAEARLLQALKSRNQSQIALAKFDLMGALDEYSKTISGIGPSSL